MMRASGSPLCFARNIIAKRSFESLFARRTMSSLKDTYEFVKVEKRDNVGLVTLHRPRALNALCDALFDDLIHAFKSLDQDDSVGCMILTGSQKAFAAGADISEMKDKTFDHAYQKVRRQAFHHLANDRVSSVGG